VALWLTRHNVRAAPLRQWPAALLREAWGAVDDYVLTQRGAARVAMEQGYPTPFVEALFQDMGAVDAEQVLAAMNVRAPLAVRVNGLRGSVMEARARLLAEGIRTHVGARSPTALVLEDRVNLYGLRTFKEGWVEAQDEGSQWVVDRVRAKPGEKVLDACAGAGGKTLALAASMKNRGRILALDPSATRLEECRRRARRAGVSNMETRKLAREARGAGEDGESLDRAGWATRVVPPWPAELHGCFDAVLVDAPCTGSGALRRNPEMRWHLRGEWLTRFPEQQVAILSEASRCVRKGGRLVYATCSLLRREDEEVVEQFLAGHDSTDEWLQPEMARIGPEQNGCDGFFVAILQRV